MGTATAEKKRRTRHAGRNRLPASEPAFLEAARVLYRAVGSDHVKFASRLRVEYPAMPQEFALRLFELAEGEHIEAEESSAGLVPTSMNGHLNGKAAPLAPVSDGKHSATVAVAKPGPAPSSPPSTTDTGRDARGKFTKGNKAGRGNPFARRLGEMRSAFLDAVTGDDVAAVAKRLLAQALDGDVQADTLFLSYAVGKPIAAVNPDRLDLDEFAIAYDAPTKARLMTVLLDAIDPAAAAEFARGHVQNDPESVVDAIKSIRGDSGAMQVHDERKAKIGR